MYSEKKSYLCADFMCTRERMVTSNNIRMSVMAVVMCLLAPFFSYSWAQRMQLGTNISNAPAISDTVIAAVTDGDGNYFRLMADKLPATVYYMQDTAFGPVPMLISVIGDDTLPAMMTAENCRMGWKWELPKAKEDEEVRYFYFASHENASAEIAPFVCQPIHNNIPGIEVCDEYVWGDTTIVTSGTYTRVLKAVSGCDSIVTQNVTINKSVKQTVEVMAYEKYTWINGQTYTKSIIGPSWDLQTVAGCDSTLTLSLKIRHLLKDTVRTAICPDELPYSWQGQQYAQVGTFTTDTLKSSTTDTDTLRTLVLTVNETYAVDTVVEICASSYIWRGQTYNKNGAYPYNGKTAAGCDSIVTLRLTLKQATAGQETVTAEGSYTWHGVTYTKSGVYTYHTTNMAGCDSTVTLTLTITEPPIIDVDTVPEYFCPKSGIVEHIDTTSNPRIHYIPYSYEKPSRDWYMEGVITGAVNTGANVNFRRVEENMDAYYQIPLMPVMAIYWRYQKRNEPSLSDLTISAQQPQWMETGTISMEVQFQCGQRFYDSFTVGNMTEGMEQLNSSEIPVKRIENGQVVIIRGGVKYTVFGTKIE